MNAPALAQDAPAFRFHAAQLRPPDALPRSSQAIAGPQLALPVLPPVVARTPRLRTEARDVASFLRRKRLSGLAVPDAAETFTFRTTDGAAVLASLSLGFQAQLQASDNVNSAPPAQALADTMLDFTPIARLRAGGMPQLQAEDSREPEFYLDALYAPTEHRLVRARQSRFLQHLLVQAGRSNAVVRAGARLTYDENLFAAGSDSAPEESFALLEIGPVVEYRTSVRTTVHFRADYRRITFDRPDGNRTERGGDAGIEYEYSPKTVLGTGFEGGRIRFDRPDFGTQNYRQGYVSAAWRATPKIRFRTRIGVEWREFHRLSPQAGKTGVVGSATLDWRPRETTRVLASFSTRNQTAITETGSLFRETRYEIEAEQSLGYSYYARCEVDYVERAHDTGRDESELTLRPAIGYRILSGAVFDTVKVELFYQYRRHWNHGSGGDYTRNQGGVQMTVFF